jgi:hypothetical protein
LPCCGRATQRAVSIITTVLFTFLSFCLFYFHFSPEAAWGWIRKFLSNLAISPIVPVASYNFFKTKTDKNLNPKSENTKTMFFDDKVTDFFRINHVVT